MVPPLALVACARLAVVKLDPIQLLVPASLERGGQAIGFLAAQSSLDDEAITVVILAMNGPRLLLGSGFIHR